MSSATKDWVKVKAEAAKWAVRAQTALSADDHAKLEAWRQADQRHEFAYRAATATWINIAALAQADAVKDRLSKPSRRERVFEALRAFPPLHWLAIRPQRRLASGVVLAAAVLFTLNLPMRSPAYETAVAESRAVTLADGSFIALSGNSRLETNFSKTERRVALTRGDAFFEVKKDPTRPFIVVAGDTMVRVVGTKFNVHRDSEEVRIAVVEGVVQVAQPKVVTGSSPFPVEAQTLTAGQQAMATHHAGRNEVRVAKLVEPTLIQPTRLDYRGAKLRDVITEANKYYAPGIVLEPDELGDLQVTMAFQTTEIEKTVEGLKDILPLDVTRNSDGRIVIRSRN